MRSLLAFCVAVLLSFCPLGFSADDLPISSGGERLVKRVTSLRELRREGVVVQQLDYSCGAAALATLLSFNFNDAVKENEVIGFIFVHGQTPEEGIKRYFRRKGFSLLDLKRFAEFRGYRAAGYKNMELKDLQEFLELEQVPVLVPINPFGYYHFVVVRAIQGNSVFVADPAVGRNSMTIARFTDIWVNGVGFVIQKKPFEEISLAPIRSEKELAQITAAGVPPSASSSASSLPKSGGSLLKVGSREPVPNAAQLVPVTGRPAPMRGPRIVQTFTDTKGLGLFTRFDAQNVNGPLQLGDPPGNFIDFTPPRSNSTNPTPQ